MLLKTTVLATILQLTITAGNFLFGILMANYFGASGKMDAYNVVANVIGLIFGLFTHFQTKALIPHMSSVEEGDKKSSVTLILRFNIVLFSIISLLLFLGSRQFVYLLAPGLEPWQLDLASQFMKISSFFLFFSNFISLGQALMEYHLKPLKALTIGIFRTIILLTFLIALHKLLGVYTLPTAHLVGTLSIAPLFLYFMKRNGYLKRVSQPLVNDHVKAYLKLAIPLFVGQIMVWSIRLSDSFLASFLDEGSIAHITYSLRIVNNFNMLFAGFFIVYFPILTRLARPEDNKEHIQTFYKGFQVLVLASLSIATYIALFSPQIIGLLFERGEFTPADTKSVSTILRFYAPMMFAAPMGSYLSNIYYSRRLPKIATIISSVSSILNIILNILFFKIWGIIGLALASSTTFLLGIIWQASKLSKANIEYQGKHILFSTIKAIVIVTITSFIVFHTSIKLPFLVDNTIAEQSFLLGLYLIYYILLILIFSHLIGMPYAKLFFINIFNKLQK